MVAFARDSLDRRLRSMDEVDNELSMPLLGFVREEAMGRVLASPNGRLALEDADVEGLRMINAQLAFLDIDRELKSVVVTSALPEEGKSTIAASLAQLAAAAGERTLLVECDLRRPTLANRLGLRAAPGLTDLLLQEASPEDVTLQLPGGRRPKDGEGGVPFAKLDCIRAGTPTPRPAELLGSKRFRDFLRSVSAAYDRVFLDTSPVLSAVDTLRILPHVDAYVFCVRISRTTRDEVRAAKTSLSQLPMRPSGVVVTGVRHGDGVADGYSGYAAYEYSGGSEVRKARS